MQTGDGSTTAPAPTVTMGTCGVMTSVLTLYHVLRTVTWVSSLIINYQLLINLINLVVEGVSTDDYRSTYGINADGSGSLDIKFVTSGPYSKNIGSRVYLTEGSGDNYYMFRLKNKEFTFDVDVSELPCGLNGALYFVEMEQDGGAHYPGKMNEK